MKLRSAVNLIVLAGLLACPVVAYADHEDVAVDRGTTMTSLDALLDDLDRMEELNDRNSNKFSRSRINERIKSMRAEVRKVRRVVRKAPALEIGPVPTVEPIATPEVAAPIAPAAFADLVAEVKNASFSKEKVALVRSACEFHLFTSAQVIQMMDTMSFGKDKVEAAALMHPAVVDPENFYKVFKHLDFEGDRKKLRGRIGAR